MYHRFGCNDTFIPSTIYVVKLQCQHCAEESMIKVATRNFNYILRWCTEEK